MVGQKNIGREQIITNICNSIKNRKKLSAVQKKLVTEFAARYYVSCSVEDLTQYSLEDMAGALLSQWELIYSRKPGEVKVRVYTPTLKKDGWQCPHTVVEVSHDDIPFLVDSIRMEITREGYQTYFAIHFGGLKVKRNKANEITDIIAQNQQDETANSEAPIFLELDRQLDESACDVLRDNIFRILGDVKVAVKDWRPMLQRAKEALAELEQNPPPVDSADLAESKDFLRWIIDNHFTFLGSRDYRLVGTDKNKALQSVPGTGLGVLRDDGSVSSAKSYADLPAPARKRALSKNILIIAKTNTKSTVHRATYTDWISVKRFNKEGEVIGEYRFIGLYTSAAYNSSPRYIPFLRHKVTQVIEAFHYPPDSHNGKELVHILETLPRDDLFQASIEELIELTRGILQLQERSRIRLFVRKDSYGRYFSCLVYVPREIFNTELTLAMQDVLMHAFDGLESSFTSYFSDSILARIHYLVRVNPKANVEYDISKIEQLLIDIARSWAEELRAHLIQQFGETQGLKYYAKYRRAFPASYTEYYLPATAIEDIRKIETLSPDHPLEMLFYKSGSTALRLKLFHSEHTIALSDVLPTLENMGLRIIGERPHEIIFKDGAIAWINDFDMVYVKNKNINIDLIKDNFQDAFANIWFGNAEDDGFNQLVLEAKLTWQETAMLRAYTRYLRQTGFTFSQSYIGSTLVNNPEITKLLVNLFKVRFDPEIMDKNTDSIGEKIEELLEEVSSLDEDRILRRILEGILATIRTNYFQKNKNGKMKESISFKLDPSLISELPLPKPKFEIFVYSPRVEGVHLRGGKVARGGLRWSDRREDFRTEVLGLMKAQQVKNSVIVPVGAKGGFFPKQLPSSGDRDAIMKEVVDCYSIFIRGLLDLTDNIKNGKIVPPKNTVRYDENDPYLVVAADKGTATFSDIANRISIEYEFWLNDAFASGGSAGYDHKKMGITARGAWESVKRHFRELGINSETTDFTVVGIGDMSGDVFGNGMLLSNHIKLLAAYNHLHIFIDPDPDPKLSFEERQRLFSLPRSSWSDYRSDLISRGGGVFSRSAKSIKITPEMKLAFGIEKDYLVPNELIRAVLRSSVDLIWNGGIGTFVKASTETHAEVGDRTNDAIRIDGNEVRARVVGEGGNLGFTQLGRIEYSLNGGNIYTDFIDNSAGVDCSDHEVNIKILLNKLVSDKEMSLDQRNKLLETMTNEVAELVLRDNYEQTQILSLEASISLQTGDMLRRFINEFEKEGRLNRRLEFLPDEKTILERKAHGQGLTRPEIAVLISYCKMFLKQDILASALPEDPYFINYLTQAFPNSLRKKFLPQMEKHSLRREIVATQLSKTIIDHMGITFIDRLQRETGSSVPFIIRAYAVAEAVFSMNVLWRQIESLDLKVSTSVQQKMMLQIFHLIRRATRWFLRNKPVDFNIPQTISEYSKPISEFIKNIPRLLNEDDRQTYQHQITNYMDLGVPTDLATNIANCSILYTALDIVDSAKRNKLPISDVAKAFNAIGANLDFNWLREQMNDYPIDNQWDELARSGFRDDLDRSQSDLSVSVLLSQEGKTSNKNINQFVETWLTMYDLPIQRWQNLMAEVKSSPNPGFVTYSVVLRELSNFVKIT